MKFGSVAFFKRVIVAGFALIVVLPVVLAVVFGVLYSGEKSAAADLAAQNLALEAQLAAPDTPEAASIPPTLNTQAPPAGPEDTQPELEPTPEAYYPGQSFDYQALYPHLYAERPEMVESSDKICYLSFDDGPSSTTLQVLDTLNAFGVKATFFVTGRNSRDNPEILQAIVEAGHTVGVHSWSHEYDSIYSSVEAFLEDFELMYTEILETTGVAPTIFRFPGGSVNKYNQYTYNAIVAEMLRRGFVFYDWNAAGSDAVEGGLSSTEVSSNVLNSATGRRRALVLLHDRDDNGTTANALPSIIRGLQNQGFTFAALSAEVPPITFYYDE